MNKLMLIFGFSEKKKYFFIFFILFLSSFIFRAPTFFNDYYDVDELTAIVQTKQYLSGAIPKIEFMESKLPVYHMVFKAAYSLSYDYGYVLVHIFTAFVIFLTSFFIFFSGKEIIGEKEGFIGALVYTVLISSFNRHFMATNGEILYCLPVTASFYFFLLVFSKERGIFARVLFLSASFVFSFIGANIKFHGLISIIYIFIILSLYLPFFKIRDPKKILRYILLYCGVILLILIGDYFTVRKIYDILYVTFSGKLFYSFVSRKISLWYFPLKFLHHKVYFLVWHFVAWIPAVIIVYEFIKKRFIYNDFKMSMLMIFFVVTYALNFSGGERLYYHYFMSSYPALCLISGIYIIGGKGYFSDFVRKKFTLLLLVPGIYFMVWNTKDVVLKHYYPAGFYEEGPVLFWYRAISIGAYNDYLLPEKGYAEVIRYVKEHTAKNDKIFVWGNGAYIYYFSDRLPGVYSMWLQNRIERILREYRSGDPERVRNGMRLEEILLLGSVRKNMPEMIIDTSRSSMVSITKFDYSIDEMPIIKDFIEKNYHLEATVQEMPIYRKKKSQQ